MSSQYTPKGKLLRNAKRQKASREWQERNPGRQSVERPERPVPVRRRDR